MSRRTKFCEWCSTWDDIALTIVTQSRTVNRRSLQSTLRHQVLRLTGRNGRLRGRRLVSRGLRQQVLGRRSPPNFLCYLTKTRLSESLKLARPRRAMPSSCRNRSCTQRQRKSKRIVSCRYVRCMLFQGWQPQQYMNTGIPQEMSRRARADSFKHPVGYAPRRTVSVRPEQCRNRRRTAASRTPSNKRAAIGGSEDV